MPKDTESIVGPYNTLIGLLIGYGSHGNLNLSRTILMTRPGHESLLLFNGTGMPLTNLHIAHRRRFKIKNKK